MMFLKGLCFALWCAMLAGPGKAQGFKKFYYLPGSLNSTACDAMEIPGNKYLVAGRTDTLIGGYIVSRLTFMATDLQGNQLWVRKYGNEKFDYPDMFQRNQFYCVEPNHVYVYCTGRDDIGNIYAVVTKMDYNGDTIWQKRFTHPLANMIPQVMIKAYDGGFYINGYYNIKTGGQPVYLMRLSGNGDSLWKKVIGKAAPNVMSGSDMIQDSASGRIIMTGYQYMGSNSASYSSVLFLDSLGNKINQLTYNNACGGAAGRILKLKDGSFITAARLSVDCSIGIYQPRFIKIDINGKLLWNKSISLSGPLNSLHPHLEYSNNDLVAFGVLDTFYITRFKYVRLNQQGNIIFQSAFGRKKDIYISDLGRGGSFTNDGGYLTAMQVSGEPSPTPFYIIKLDSMGCDTMPWYCEWEKTVALKQQAQTLQAEVFPNPCRDVLNVGVSREGLPATANVFDQSGRKVFVQEAITSKNRLDVSSLPDGFFLLEIRSGTGVFRSNFVVQR